jgi:sensor histidine kinase YesM
MEPAIMLKPECVKPMRVRKRQVSRWVRFAWVSIASGSMPSVLNALFGHPSWKQFIGKALEGMIFAACIGALCFLILPKIAESVIRMPPALRWFTLVSVISSLASIGCAVATGILVVIRVVTPQNYWADYLESLKFCILLALAFGLSAFFHETILARFNSATAELKAKEEAAEKLRQVAMEARLSSLESRVQPHFLFNTLNSILALIREDPHSAERMVEQLAALLRFSLDANQSRLVPLSLETKIVRDYLEIERARFGARLRYSIDIPAALNEVGIPPMALQTLVENSVKYAVSPRREGATILLRARMGEGSALVEVIDDGPGLSAAHLKPGHGLELLQDRLDGLFGPSASLLIETPLAGGTRIAILLPATAQAAVTAPGALEAFEVAR